MSQPRRWPYGWKVWSLGLGILGCLLPPTWGMTEGAFGVGQGVGTAAENGWANGRQGNGHETSAQGSARYWDPPPGFRGDEAGEGERVGVQGYGSGGYESGKFPDRPNGYGGDSQSNPPGLESSWGPDGRAVGGLDGSFAPGSTLDSAPGSHLDSETLDPRREIDPYFLRKRQESGYSGSQAPWGSGGWDSRSTGYRSGGYDGGDGYRMNQAAPFRYDDPAGGRSGYRAEGTPSDGRGYPGYRGYGEASAYPGGTADGAGLYRDRDVGASAGRGMEQERYDGRGGNRSGGSFSWNGNSDWSGMGDRPQAQPPRLR
ncbi:MAG: hypothetical protein HQL07_15250, partial [Nitrospirae bacterium]|nr:hypothetical protein [Magnetococcales bacterium]